MYICHHCKKEVHVERKVTRSETCPHCNADLRCCLNCAFYDAAVYNACMESQAERCVEKDKANFCAYFSYADSETVPLSGMNPPEQKKRENPLDALFRKK